MKKLKYLNDKVIKKALAHESKDIRNYVARLISDTTHIPYEDLEDKLELIYPEVSINGHIVNSEVDLIYKEENLYFNIEINYGRSKTLKLKNLTYTFQLALRDIKNAKLYENKNKIIQININSFDPYGYGELLYEAQMMVKKYGIVHNDRITIYEINLAYLENIPYNEMERKSLLRDLALFVVEDKKVLEKLYKDDRVMESVQKEMDNFTKTLDEILFYDAEELQRQIEEEKIEEIKEKLKEEIFQEVEKSKSIEIAKSLLAMGVLSLEQIAEVTKLSIEKIEKLKQS